MNMQPATRLIEQTPAARPSVSPSTIAFAATLLAQRMMRNEHFEEFGSLDTRWFVLLELFVVADASRRLSLSDLYNVAGVPKSTVLRAIDDLVASGHLTRQTDPRDARRRLVWLSSAAHARLNHLLERLRETMSQCLSGGHVD